MRKGPSFTIPSFVAAGLVPFSAAAAETSERTADDGMSAFDSLKEIVQSIEDSHSYTLAQHRSHASHQSHGSHQSHRSSSFRSPPAGEGDTLIAPVAYPETRNELSTPPNAVLPSSPAIASPLRI